jgi:hypothetical protein
MCNESIQKISNNFRQICRSTNSINENSILPKPPKYNQNVWLF